MGVETEKKKRGWPKGRPRDPDSQRRFGNKNSARRLEKQFERLFPESKPLTAPKLTKERVEEVAECFLDGLTDEETGWVTNIHQDTIRKWRTFNEIKKHEVQRKRFYVQEARFGKRHDWTRIAWWLERRYPLEFSRPEVAHAIATANITNQHLTQNLTQNLVVSPETAQMLAQRAASVGESVAKLFAGDQPVRQKLPETFPRIVNLGNVSPESPAKITSKEDRKLFAQQAEKALADEVTDDMSAGPQQPEKALYRDGHSYADHHPPPPRLSASQNTDSLSRPKNLKNPEKLDLNRDPKKMGGVLARWRERREERSLALRKRLAGMIKE